MKRTAALLLSTVIFATGCGGSALPRDGAPPSEVGVHDLYPLAEGHAWAYDVDTGDGDSVLAVTKVVSTQGEQVTVRTGGDELVRYALRPQGIFRLGTRTWLLQTPLELGQRWPASGGATAEVTRTGYAMDTPAGHFEACVEVQESGGEAGIEVRTVYCPRVGPVHVESFMPARHTGQTAKVVASLRGYQTADTP